MDLIPLAQAAQQLVEAVAVPAALTVVTWGLRQAQTRWKFTVSKQLQDAVTADIESAVNVGVGWGRAKLAAGEMQLGHVTTGNAFVDQLAQGALTMLSADTRASGITTDILSRRIVAGLGHALGNDPNVVTIASAPAGGDAQPATSPGARSGPAALPIAPSNQAAA